LTFRSALTGLVHATSSPGALAVVDRFQTELLCYGVEAGAVLAARDIDPDYALAHALAGALQLFTMTPSGFAAAADSLETAGRLARRADPRERMLVQAICLWGKGRTAEALALHLAIAEAWPRDLISGRIAQYHLLNRGDFAGMHRLTGLLVPANPDVPAVMGMHAFALEQTGDLAEAERLARAAADAGFDPWAEHALAHVLERSGRAREGIAFLSARTDGWLRCSSFLRTHNWWHLALLHLELGDREAALMIHDACVWGVRKDYCHDQVNSISLLARLELHGVDVGARWADLGQRLGSRTGEHVNGFLDLHYLYGLARAGAWEEVSTMQRSLHANARRADDPVWREIVPAAAAGLVAQARGHCAEAAVQLGRVLPRLHLVGGSSAQRHLFTLLHRDALARA
jgi:tetratricopeptide (TPR) repeat protein